MSEMKSFKRVQLLLRDTVGWTVESMFSYSFEFYILELFSTSVGFVYIAKKGEKKCKTNFKSWLGEENRGNIMLS